MLITRDDAKTKVFFKNLSLEKSVKGEEQADSVEDWTSLLGAVKEVGLQET